MTIAEEVINALSKRLKKLSADATPEEIAYLAKTLESVAGQSTVLDIVNMTDEKLEALLSATTKHLSDLNTNKASSLSAITEAKKKSLEAIDTLKTSALSDLKISGESHMSLLDMRKNENIAEIESTGKEQLSTLKGLVTGFQAIAGNPSVLQEILGNDNLETWLKNPENQAKLDSVLSNSHCILAIIDHSSALDNIIKSPLAIQVLVKSKVALRVVANFAFVMRALVSSKEIMDTIAASSSARDIIRNSSTAMDIVSKNSMAIAKLASGLAGLTPTSYADMSSIVASATAIDSIVSSAVALNAIVKSELACRAIEANIQSHRSTVVNTLNASPSLFTKQSGIKIGNGNATVEHDTNSSTIYIPTSCNDDGDTDFYVNSLLTKSQIASISRHRGDVNVTSGIALRGIQVHGSGSSVGNVTFDIYTAI